MEQKYSVETLREKIKELELRQKEEGKLLKTQLAQTYENLKPVNIVKSLIGDVFESKSLRDEFISSAASYTSGLLTRKLVTGNSQNPLLKIVGLGLQFGITALVTKNYDSIKGIFSQYLNAFLSKLSDSVNNLSFEKDSEPEKQSEN